MALGDRSDFINSTLLGTLAEYYLVSKMSTYAWKTSASKLQVENHTCNARM